MSPVSSVVRRDVDLLGTRLLGGQAPAVDVVRALLLLLGIGPFLLQLLPLELRPPVLEPHLDLRGGGQNRVRPRAGLELKSLPILFTNKIIFIFSHLFDLI